MRCTYDVGICSVRYRFWRGRMERMAELMNREDIDILEVGNAYTALFYKKNHYQPYIVAWHFDPDSYTWD